MSFYKTKIAKLGAGYAVDTFGKRLTFVGNYPCQAGDTVWTDGKFIFGNISPKPQPVIFDEQGGIPVLAVGLRGYFNSGGTFKSFPVAEDISDGNLVSYWWLINNNKKIFYNNIESNQEPFEDIEIADNNSVFTISRFSGWYDASNYFQIYPIAGDSDYTFSKNFDDFKSGNEVIEPLFFKLQKDTETDNPVKWFAVFRSTLSNSSSVSLPPVKHYTFSQQIDYVQTISFSQPGIWNCSAKFHEEETVDSVDWTTTHEEIFSIDSDGHKNIIYKCDSSGSSSSIEYVTTEKIVPYADYSEKLGAGPSLMYFDNTAYNYIGAPFDGTLTIEWTGIGISKDTFAGTRYSIVKEKIPVNLSGGTDSEFFEPFAYPVQDGFYISAEDINSPLKLFDADDKLVLNFETSGDNFLANLAGFHNFAAILIKKGVTISDREYLLTIHDFDFENFRYKPFYLWKIHNGKVTRLSDACLNFRFNKIKNILKTRE